MPDAAPDLYKRRLPEYLKVPWKFWQVLLVFAAAWLVVPAIVIVALKFAAPSAHWAEHVLDGLQNGDVYVSFGFVLLSALAAVGMVWYYLRRYGLGWSAVGWRKIGLWRAAWNLFMVLGVFFLAITAIFALAQAFLPGFNANQPQTNQFTGSAGRAHPSIALLALVIIPPFIEETYFRGFLFPALAKRLGLVGGAVVTSLLFGLAHLQANVGLYTFVLSLGLCYLYWRLGSIIPGIALHMLNNYLAYLVLVHG